MAGRIAAKAVRYITAGCTARAVGSPERMASQARKEPANIFTIPGRIQPGPAPITASHQRQRRPGSAGGMKRRKSTCSPTCAISETTTEAQAPKERRVKPPASPPKATHCPSGRLPRAARARKGSRFSVIHTGCVQRWKRLMKAMPCVTIGITATAAIT